MSEKSTDNDHNPSAYELFSSAYSIRGQGVVHLDFDRAFDSEPFKRALKKQGELLYRYHRSLQQSGGDA